MASLAFDENRLVLSDGTGAGRAGLDLQALSPVLIGFMSPWVVLLTLDPTSLQHTRFTAVLVLILVFVLAAVVFVHSAFTPGRSTAATFDPDARTATITRRGAFASRCRTIPFDDIDAIELVTTYDDDGYPTQTPELHLASGEIVPLPAGTGVAQLDMVGRLLGLV